MKSMTGYGKATVSQQGRELSVELKSVNHRFLDISAKLPRVLSAHDDVVRNTLATYVSRGHVDVFVNFKVLDEADKVVSVDVALAKGYVEAAKALKTNFPQAEYDLTVGALMRCPDVLKVEQKEEEAELLRAMLKEALCGAAENLNQMRQTEGERLKRDIVEKIELLEQILHQIVQIAPDVVHQHTQKLRQRIQQALGDVALDEAKLANEVCFYADKCCIDEETTRLQLHLQHALQILQEQQPVGRKLDFLVQEFNREANTICSKSGSAQLTDLALQMKNEIEKIREQIQNIE